MLQGRNRLSLPTFLNSIANEGILEGSNILMVGPPGVGKTVFCENFMKHYLLQEAYSIYVTLEKTPEEITFSFRTNGVDLKGVRIS
ncbi:hypothetical protein H8E65_00850 [Candidatus Bathyarchaeota archaeon]|nr:hypothetical protein [Candidatus Bathyarchaeota archaeon]